MNNKPNDLNNNVKDNCKVNNYKVDNYKVIIYKANNYNCDINCSSIVNNISA